LKTCFKTYSIGLIFAYLGVVTLNSCGSVCIWWAAFTFCSSPSWSGSDFFGPDLGPKFGPSQNWKFPNIFPISDLKIPNHYQNYKKRKKRKVKEI
jgi:hypothetical protein